MLSLLNEPGEGDTKLFNMARRLVDEMNLRLSVQQWRLSLQDSWMLSYLLVDQAQDNAPRTWERYYTPRAANIVDTARRVLTRNPLRYHMVSQHFQNESLEQREPVRRLENVFHGILEDIDRQLVARGEMNAWAYKYHLSRQARSSTNSPQSYTQLDPRLVLPTFGVGVEDAIAFDVTTLGYLMGPYDEVIRPVVDRVISQRQLTSAGGEIDYGFMHVPLTVMEWSSKDEHGLLLDLGALDNEIADQLSISPSEHGDRRYVWLEEPYAHGFKRSMIQYGNVNGLNLKTGDRQISQQLGRSPYFGGAIDTSGTGGATTGQRNTILNANGSIYNPLGKQATSIDPNSGMAGRSIFAMVQHLFPELNRMTALLKDSVVKEIRGTWVMKSRDGSLQNIEIGTGKLNALTLQETLEKIDPHIQAPDALAISQNISQEISDGSLDLRFVLASESDGTGFLRARMEQAAVVSLEDYKDGLANWALSLGETFISQFRAARKGSFKQWKVTGHQPGIDTRFFVIDIDDDITKMLKEAKEPPVIEASVKAAMPVDMMSRINMAKAAIDPSNPIMSLAQALDTIMEFDDADAAYKAILEDTGNRNPTIQLLNIAAAFTDNGAPEVATMILNDQFRAAFAQARSNQQGATTTPSGSTPGINPSTAPPELTSGGGTEQPVPASVG